MFWSGGFNLGYRVLTFCGDVFMSKVSPFSIVTSDCTIESILQSGVCVKKLLLRLGFPDCTRCSVRFDETLKEATLNYRLNLEAVLMALNANIVKERMRNTMNSAGSEATIEKQSRESNKGSGGAR